MQVASVTTNAGGRYTAGAPGGGFTVCFGLPDAYADYLFTDADLATGCTAGGPSVDAGIVSPPNALGGMVWVDVDRDGVREDGEPPVPGVTVTVQDGKGHQLGTTTTGADGRYGVSNLPDGTFTVCFGMPVTRPNAGEDDLDSDVNPLTACTWPVNLGPGNRQDPTIDAGQIPPGGSAAQG